MKARDNLKKIIIGGKEMPTPDDMDFIIDRPPDVLYPDCDCFHEKKNEYTSPYGSCQFCYRYDICLEAYLKNSKFK